MTSVPAPPRDEEVADLSLDALERIRTMTADRVSATMVGVHSIADEAIRAAAKSPSPRPAGEEVAGLALELTVHAWRYPKSKAAPMLVRAANALSTLAAEREAMEGAKRACPPPQHTCSLCGAGVGKPCLRPAREKGRAELSDELKRVLLVGEVMHEQPVGRLTLDVADFRVQKMRDLGLARPNPDANPLDGEDYPFTITEAGLTAYTNWHFMKTSGLLDLLALQHKGETDEQG